MNIASEMTGERIAHAVAVRAHAREVLAASEYQPSSFMVGLNVLCMGLATAFVAGHYGTRIEAMLGALGGVSFVLSITSYANGLRQNKRLEAMFIILSETAP